MCGTVSFLHLLGIFYRGGAMRYESKRNKNLSKIVKLEHKLKVKIIQDRMVYVGQL